MIWLPPKKQVALPSRQRGFLLNPFRFAGGGDPNFASVVALLHMDGANGSSAFTDNSPLALTWTRANQAQISTAQSKFGGASGLFDGVDDRVRPTANAGFNLTGDFTIEGWSYYDSTASNSSRRIIDLLGANTCYIYRVNTTTLAVNVAGSTESGSAASDTWVYFALARSGTAVRFFINGAQVGSTITSSATLGSSVTAPALGDDLNSRTWKGWIDELRITKGVARYTSNFTPPSAAFPNS